MFFNKDKKDADAESEHLALLPLRDLVVFPYMVVPLIVGREMSIKALEEAAENDKRILLATQHSAATEEPGADDIYSFGTIANIIQMLRLPDGTVKVLVEGKHRARITAFIEAESHFRVEVEGISELEEGDPKSAETVANIKALFEEYVKLNKSIPPEMLLSISSIENPSRLADT